MFKKKYLDKKETIDNYFEVEGSFEDLIETYNDLRKAYPNHYNFRLENDYYGHDGDRNLGVVAYRKETEEERKARLASNRKAKEAAALRKVKEEEEEYKQYLKLREKYKKLGEGFYNG
jgi:hypothetical protein